ncbi:MAG: BrnT family toxin [Chloroflexi bacterium]|nr:BrnT family toxin [Chloroflexota bacterium]
MYIADIIWLPQIIDTLAWKHDILPEEVDEIFFGDPKYRRVQKGHIPGEHVYSVAGQTVPGRYLIVFFIYKPTQEALIISARDMTRKERRYHAQG